jgi:membrane-bound ClpP family serine protease
MIPYVLWILGLLFVLMEFYMPGIILGTIGGILLITSVILFIEQSSSPVAIILFMGAVGISLGFLIKYTIREIPKSKKGFNIYLNKDQAGYYASSFDATAIGKTGVVISDLKPAGYIVVDGKRHQAISISGRYLPQGTHVIVIRGQEESLIVKPNNEE